MRVKGYLAALIVACLWGVSFIATKVALSGFNPIGVIFFKFCVSSIMFTVLFKVKKINFKVDRLDKRIFFVSAFFGSFLYFFLEGSAINMLNASSAALILAVEPVVIMIMSYFVNKERLNIVKKISIPVSILGVWFIVKGSNGGDSLLGYFLMFSAVVMWGIYVVNSAKLTSKYSEVKIAGIQSFIALALYTPFVFMIEFHTIGISQIVALLYIGLIPSGLALFLYIYSLKTIGNSTTSLFINFVPVVTSIVGIIYLGEMITLNKVIGGLIVILIITISLIVDLKEENQLTSVK